MADYPQIIDISHHNTVKSFSELAASGMIGVIHKATEGVSYSDADFWERRDAARAAGLEWASYHFLKHGNVEAQMQNFLNIVQPESGERMIIDYEDAACTLDDLHQAIDYLRKLAPGVEITVYSGHLIKDQLGNKRDALLATTSLWIAQYTSAAAPSWPRGTWPVWTLWQFTDAASVPGIAPPTDLNRFNGSEDNLRLWFNPAALAPEPPAPPAPAPDGQPVKIYVDVPQGVVVEIFVNGEPQN